MEEQKQGCGDSSGDSNHTVPKRFKTLSFYGKLNRAVGLILAYTGAIVVIISGAIILHSLTGPDTYDDAFLQFGKGYVLGVGIGAGIGCILFGIGLIIFGEYISCFIAIEENTRRVGELLEARLFRTGNLDSGQNGD